MRQNKKLQIITWLIRVKLQNIKDKEKNLKSNQENDKFVSIKQWVDQEPTSWEKQ